MNEKCYYGYVRPKLPNHPWSLEKIPLGKSILTTSKEVELKNKKLVPFDIKESDDLGITLNQDGSFTLPIGKYLLELQFLAELPVAGDIMLSINNHMIADSLQASTPKSVSGMALAEVTEDGTSIGLTNSGKELIKLSDVIVVITKL